MVIKLLIFAIVGMLIYRLFGGKFPTLRKNEHQQKLDEDTLVECVKCGTYVTVKESLISDAKYYCSKECTY